VGKFKEILGVFLLIALIAPPTAAQSDKDRVKQEMRAALPANAQCFSTVMTFCSVGQLYDPSSIAMSWSGPFVIQLRLANSANTPIANQPYGPQILRFFSTLGIGPQAAIIDCWSRVTSLELPPNGARAEVRKLSDGNEIRCVLSNINPYLTSRPAYALELTVQQSTSF
jgi:hypothetical protein